MAPDKSLEAVVWVAVGGRGTLIGAGHRRDRCQRAEELGHPRLSGSLAHCPRRNVRIVVLFMPKGIVGLPAQLFTLLQARFRLFEKELGTGRHGSGNCPWKLRIPDMRKKFILTAEGVSNKLRRLQGDQRFELLHG